MAMVAAWLLAAVFGTAGIAKLLAPEATAASFRALGVPGAGPAARGLPLVEVAIAGLLVVSPRAGGVAALVVLAGFTGFLAARLAAGVRADCGCLGAATAKPLSWATLLRNGLLAGLASAVIVTPAGGPGVADVVLVGTTVALGAVLLALADLKVSVGRVWDTDTPGRQPPDADRHSAVPRGRYAQAGEERR
ncbi:MAG: MauE/DoxX family redox-associated membrane protein [Egibacteraceae bacterium]